MNKLDCIEVWFESLRSILDSSDVAATFNRTMDQRINPSAVVNFRRVRAEVDFTLWESGEAELCIVNTGGQVSHEHFDDLSDNKKLATVLSRVVKLMQLK